MKTMAMLAAALVATTGAAGADPKSAVKRVRKVAAPAAAADGTKAE